MLKYLVEYSDNNIKLFDTRDEANEFVVNFVNSDEFDRLVVIIKEVEMIINYTTTIKLVPNVFD